MVKKKKLKSIFQRLNKIVVSLIVAVLVIVAQAIIILNLLPSIEEEGSSVLKANVQALLDMVNR